jgi:hypothetical protein
MQQQSRERLMGGLSSEKESKLQALVDAGLFSWDYSIVMGDEVALGDH